MKATIWHNPRCSKSCVALAILRDACAEVTVREYLRDAPARDEIAALLERGRLSPAEVLRRGEDGAKTLATADDAAILDAMAEQPVPIERPLIETAKGVRLGRPPERVREIL